MTYQNSRYRDKCKICGKELVYSISDDRYEFCNCLETFNNTEIKEEPKGYIPLSHDQVSIADKFEEEIQVIIDRYCGQGMTIGSALGALQNRVFSLTLNIHLPNIIQVVKRNMK